MPKTKYLAEDDSPVAVSHRTEKKKGQIFVRAATLPSTPKRPTDSSPPRSGSRSPTKRQKTTGPSIELLEGLIVDHGGFEADWVDVEDPEGVSVDQPIVEDHGRSHKSQADYVREWVPRAPAQLAEILRRDQLVNGGTCCECGALSGWWRCLDCMGTPAMCRECCRKEHKRLPFHRIEYWNQSHYVPDWLSNLGCYLRLGHSGNECPESSVILSMQESEPEGPVGDSGRVDLYANPSKQRDYPSGTKSLTIVHKNGAHKCWVAYCSCPNRLPDDLQLICAGLFPLSYTNIQSAFTFQMLHDFRLDNLIGHTSAYHYYKKLRRLTHSMFHSFVIDRYRELMRVYKQWRYFHHLIRSACTTVFNTQQAAGSLATFCGACPQPGVNLSEDWQSDPNQLPYQRSFVMDGNFSAVHQRRVDRSNEIHLGDGGLFMVKTDRFSNYLRQAQEIQEDPTCNQYHAVNDRFVKHKARDVSGIGATACARHGAFCPAGVVNFQLGERQVNMDYSLCSAIANSNVTGIDSLIVLYDINCQYNVNFRKRVSSNPGISLSNDYKITSGIGEFHVTAHIPQCFARYSPQFIKGAGNVDGEILETLWAGLRDIFPSTHISSLITRSEALDDQMEESNAKKLGNLVSSIQTKHARAIDQKAKSAHAFQKLTKRVNEYNAEFEPLWEEAAKQADENRRLNVQTMDVYDSKYEVRETQSQRLNIAIQEEAKSGRLKGSSDWILEGMRIQEAQHKIRVLQKRNQQGRSQASDLNLQRERLQKRILKWHEEADRYLPVHVSEEPVGPGGRDWERDDFIDSEESDWEDEEEPELGKGLKAKRKVVSFDRPRKRVAAPLDPNNALKPENQPLLLPSTLGYNTCVKHNLLELVNKERSLRIGQANDALASIRVAIGEKSFLLRKKIRNGASKKMKLKSWDIIRGKNKDIQENHWIYNKARESLLLLEASSEDMKPFRLLEESDLRTITSILQPNAPGQKDMQLSWIWTIGGDGTNIQNVAVEEVLRVSWMRARARRTRWEEEFTLTRYEMVWTIRYFLYRAGLWERYANREDCVADAFARREAYQWRLMALRANVAFLKVDPALRTVFGYKSP